MSRLEKGAKALDDNRIKRLLIQDSDFDNYMNDRDGDEHTELKSPNYFIDDVIEYFDNGGALNGDKSGFKKLDDRFRYGDSQVSVYQGINGHGKSLFLGQVFLNLMIDQKVCIISPEMTPVHLIARMTKQYYKQPHPHPQQVIDWCNFANEKCWIYDFQNAVTEDKLISLMFYATEKLGIKHILIDSLMKVQNLADDDYNGQKLFVSKLCNIARKTKSHIHLVAHSRKGLNEMEAPDKMSVSGSASITNLVDNVFCIFRNKSKESIDPLQMTDDEVNDFDAHLIIQKNRHGDFEGSLGMYFDVPTQSYRDSYEK